MSRLWEATARFADRWWRAPLVLAATVFAASGPAHALGRADAVFYASLGGVGLGGLGVVLGCLAQVPEYVASGDEESA